MNRGYGKHAGVLVSSVVIAGFTASTARAQDPAPSPVWYFRLGVIDIESQVDSSSFDLAVRAIPGVTFGSGPLPNDAVGVEPLTLVGGSVGVVLPVLDHRLAIETIVALPKKPKVILTGTLATESILPTVFGIPTGIPPLGRDLAEVSGLPPMFTVVYRAPSLGPVTPILGAGGIALLFADVQVTNPLLNRISKVEFDFPPSFGLIAQVGADVHLWGPVQARFDVKYMSLATNFTIKNIQIKTGLPLVGDLDVGDAEVRASFHAWLVHLGVGVDF